MVLQSIQEIKYLRNVLEQVSNTGSLFFLVFHPLITEDFHQNQRPIESCSFLCSPFKAMEGVSSNNKECCRHSQTNTNMFMNSQTTSKMKILWFTRWIFRVYSHWQFTFVGGKGRNLTMYISDAGNNESYKAVTLLKCVINLSIKNAT